MKQKDLLLIIVMVFIGTIISLVVSKLVFSSPKSRQQSAEVVDLITPEFPQPSAVYFNKTAVNPSEHVAAPQPPATPAKGTTN